jgi:hypothetical protein
MSDREREHVDVDARDEDDVRRNDDLVTGTVNASNRVPVTADDIATWIREETSDAQLAQHALTTFFFEVPLNTQVAFLHHHGIDEEQALRFARSIDTSRAGVPLERRARW